MKNLACATGLVVLCLLKATLVWISCWRAGAHRRGVAQPRRPARVTGSADRENEKVACESASFSLSANELETRVRFPSPAPLIINDFTPSPHL